MARTVWLRTRNSEPQARNEFHHRGTEDTKNLNGLELGVRLNGQRSVAPNPELQTPNPERISPLRNNENYLCPSITRKKKISKNWLPGLLQKRLRGASSCVGQRNSVFRPPC